MNSHSSRDRYPGEAGVGIVGVIDERRTERGTAMPCWVFRGRPARSSEVTSMTGACSEGVPPLCATDAPASPIKEQGLAAPKRSSLPSLSDCGDLAFGSVPRCTTDRCEPWRPKTDCVDEHTNAQRGATDPLISGSDSGRLRWCARTASGASRLACGRDRGSRLRACGDRLTVRVRPSERG